MAQLGPVPISWHRKIFDKKIAVTWIELLLQISMQRTYTLTNIFVIHTVPARKWRQGLRFYETSISNCTQTEPPIMPGQYLKLYPDSTSDYTMTVPPIMPREYLKLYQDNTLNYAMTLPQIRPLLLPFTSFPIHYSIILLPFYATWCEPGVYKSWVQGHPGELLHMEAPNICE